MKKPKDTLMLLAILATVISCDNTKKSENTSEPAETVATPKAITYDTNDAKSIIKAVEMACGSWNKLWEQKDVEFTYSYKYPGTGQEDFSTERYVFDTEQSWAKYTKHDINAMPGTDGEVIQYYDGSSAMMMHNEKMLDDPEALGGAQFLRKANYFWFVMMYKLDNPGANYEYLGSEGVGGMNYDKVKVSYDASVTGKEQNDTYILYVNPETKMVDQFYFSLPIMGVTEPMIIMKLKYEEINGLQIATERHIYMPGAEGYAAEPDLVQKSTNVKFNNGFTAESFKM